MRPNAPSGEIFWILPGSFSTNQTISTGDLILTKPNRTKESLLSKNLLRELFILNNKNELVWQVSKRGLRAGTVAGCVDTSSGYRVIRINGVMYRAHRLIWLWHYGKFPANQIDHIDGNKLNNDIKNLRDVTNQENHKNQPKRSDNKSGCTGVRWNSNANKFRAEIRKDGKTIHLGYFDTLEEAVAARKAANIKYKFHENHGS